MGTRHDYDETITMKICDDGAIWVTSDVDGNGIEMNPIEGTDEDKNMLIALVQFLGYDPMAILNL